MKKISLLFCALFAVTLLSVDGSAAKKNVIHAMGGTPIPELGLAIDASYDPRLNDLVPGYKVINVAIINESLNIIYLNPEGDKWSVKLSGSKKLIPVIHDLRTYDPKVWTALPEKVKGLVGYPLVLAVGARQVIDLFVSDNVDVERFTELHTFLKSMGAKIEVLVRQ